MIDEANNPLHQGRADAALDAAITHALQQAPTAAVPADFASHLRTFLPARPIARPRTSAARIAATGAVAASLVALCWLAPHAAPNFQSMAFDLELALLTELAAIAAWLATERGEV